MPTRSEVFAAYDGDPDAILEAWPNLDPDGYAAWERTALQRMLRTDVRAWQRRQHVRIDRDLEADRSGQGQLVDVPRKRQDVRMRAKLTADGGSVDFLDLAGPDGAKVLREAALRDKPGALTTIARCERLLRLADLIASESERQGRPVTVAEVIERVAA
mgnify:CR=1 FL=1